MNHYSRGITSYFIFQIKTFSDLPYVSTLERVARFKRFSGFTLLLRTHCNPRREHDRLITQHNLDARVKHRFRLRKRTDQETIAGRALSGNEGSPHLDFISIYSGLRSFSQSDSSQRKDRGSASPAARDILETIRALCHARVKIHLQLSRERRLYLYPRRKNVTHRRFVSRARYLHNRATNVTARADHYFILA